MVHCMTLSLLPSVKLMLVLFIHTDLDLVNAVSGVTLQKYTQQDSVTSCLEGLITLQDKMVFRTLVDLTAFNNTLRSVSYEVKRHTRLYFKSVCFLKIPSMCKGYNNKECYCQPTQTENLYLFVLNATAYEIYSRGFVKVSVMLKNLSILSTDTINIPPIYDPSYIWSSFSINNVFLQETKCRAMVSGKEVKIEYTCDIDWPSPCRLEILDASTNDTVLRGSNVIKSTKSFDGPTNLTWVLKKQYCHGTEEHTFHCFIHVESREEVMMSSTGLTIIYSVAILFVLVLVVTLVSCLCWKKKIKRASHRKEKSINNEEETELNSFRGD